MGSEGGIWRIGTSFRILAGTGPHMLDEHSDVCTLADGRECDLILAAISARPANSPGPHPVFIGCHGSQSCPPRRSTSRTRQPCRKPPGASAAGAPAALAALRCSPDGHRVVESGQGPAATAREPCARSQPTAIHSSFRVAFPASREWRVRCTDFGIAPGIGPWPGVMPRFTSGSRRVPSIASSDLREAFGSWPAFRTAAIGPRGPWRLLRSARVGSEPREPCSHPVFFISQNGDHS